MEKTKCDRCGRVEDIPTHQYVKFDDKISYLCTSCWDEFRRWAIKKGSLGGGTGESSS